MTCDAVDALALELEDFVESIRTVRQPRVTGEPGRDALAVAEQILASIAATAGRQQCGRVSATSSLAPQLVTCGRRDKPSAYSRQIPVLDHQQRDEHRQRQCRPGNRGRPGRDSSAARWTPVEIGP